MHICVAVRVQTCEQLQNKAVDTNVGHAVIYTEYKFGKHWQRSAVWFSID